MPLGKEDHQASQTGPLLKLFSPTEYVETFLGPADPSGSLLTVVIDRERGDTFWPTSLEGVCEDVDMDDELERVARTVRIPPGQLLNRRVREVTRGGEAGKITDVYIPVSTLSDQIFIAAKKAFGPRLPANPTEGFDGFDASVSFGSKELPSLVRYSAFPSPTTGELSWVGRWIVEESHCVPVVGVGFGDRVPTIAVRFTGRTNPPPDPTVDVFAISGEGVYVSLPTLGDSAYLDADGNIVMKSGMGDEGEPPVVTDKADAEFSRLQEVRLKGRALLRRAAMAHLYGSPRFFRVVMYHFRNAVKAGSLTFQEAYAIMRYEFGGRVFFFKEFYEGMSTHEEVRVLVKENGEWVMRRARNEFYGSQPPVLVEEEMKRVLHECKMHMLKEWTAERLRGMEGATKGSEDGDQSSDEEERPAGKKIIRSKDGNLGESSYSQCRKFKEYLMSYARLVSVEQLEEWADNGFDFHQVMAESWIDRHGEWRRLLERKLVYHSVVILDNPKRQGHYKPEDYYMVGFGWKTWRELFEAMDPRKVAELEAKLPPFLNPGNEEAEAGEEFDLDIDSSDEDDL